MGLISRVSSRTYRDAIALVTGLFQSKEEQKIRDNMKSYSFKSKAVHKFNIPQTIFTIIMYKSSLQTIAAQAGPPFLQEAQSDASILPLPTVFDSLPSTLERGRKRYEELQTKVKYSDCWAQALQILESGCSKMCDDEQRRVAHQFTYCHMKSSGRVKPSLPDPCPKGVPILTCTREMTEMTFNVFTEFFTHVHDICYHLQQTYWQQQTEDTVRRLASSSQSLASQLIESEKLALKTIEYQRSIEGFTEKIVDQEKRHRDAFEELREWIKSDVISTITDDFMAFHSVLYKNSQMMGTALFYIGASVATFLITCSTRAHSARFPMLLILPTRNWP